MEQEDTIIENIIEQLKTVVTDKDVKVVKSKDFTEDRGKYMVVVSIEGVQNVNPLLKDYKFLLKIMVDFFIKDDPEGYDFKKTEKEIWNFMQSEYLVTRMNLTNIEEGIVGCFLDDKIEAIDETSNVAYLTYNLIGSWD